LRLQGVSRNFEARLRAPQIDIIDSKLAEQRDESRALILDRGREAGIGDFNAPTRTAEDVDLPTRIETHLKEVLGAERSARAAALRAGASGGARTVTRGEGAGTAVKSRRRCRTIQGRP